MVEGLSNIVINLLYSVIITVEGEKKEQKYSLIPFHYIMIRSSHSEAMDMEQKGLELFFWVPQCLRTCEGGG